MKLKRAVSVAISMAILSAWSGVPHAYELGNTSETATAETIEQASVAEGIDTSVNLNLTAFGEDIVASAETGNIQISNNDGQATVESNSGSLVIDGSDGHTLATDGRKTATVGADASGWVRVGDGVVGCFS